MTANSSLSISNEYVYSPQFTHSSHKTSVKKWATSNLIDNAVNTIIKITDKQAGVFEIIPPLVGICA